MWSEQKTSMNLHVFCASVVKKMVTQWINPGDMEYTEDHGEIK
jgi:hypothetical protein